MVENLSFRFAGRADVPVILDLIRELAAYERAEDEVRATPEILQEWLFDRQAAEVLLAEVAGEGPDSADAATGANLDAATGVATGANVRIDASARGSEKASAGTVVGMAVFFQNFSTWTGKGGMYLEDFVVRADCRGAGVGRAIVAELARICQQRGWVRLDWACLNWNEPSLGFYRHVGAERMDEWVHHRLSGASLAALAAEADACVAKGSPALGGGAAGDGLLPAAGRASASGSPSAGGDAR